MIEQLLAMFPGSHTTNVVVLAAGLIGAAGGALGCLAVLRRQALMGDVLAHAALPGLVLAALLTGSRSPAILALGALVAGIIAALLPRLLTRVRGVREDSALAIVLSGSFGLGLLLLSIPGPRGTDVRAGLERYLLGQAGSTLISDVELAAYGGLIVALALLLFWKELKLLVFDRESAAVQGYPIRRLDALFSGLLAASIVMGLSMVGVVLMTAVLVAPAVAARPFTNRLGPMVILAAIIGSAGGVSGALISGQVERVPTGPAVALVLALIVVVAYLIGPRGGWLGRAKARRRGVFPAIPGPPAREWRDYSLQLPPTPQDPDCGLGVPTSSPHSSTHRGFDRTWARAEEPQETEGTQRRTGPPSPEASP
jgi:manganese/zinc/iron transport system permease protein